MQHFDDLVVCVANGRMVAGLPALPADAVRADQLRCARNGGEQGIVRRIWPHMYCVLACDTGSFALYRAKILPLLGGEIPIVSPFLAATEGLLGVSTDLLSKTYSPTNALLMEFVDVEAQTNPPTVVPLEDLVINRTYELVVTTYSGLIRYRVGDVVKLVARLPSGLPRFEFLHRMSTVMDIRGERVGEDEILSALPLADIVDFALVHHLVLDDTTLR